MSRAGKNKEPELGPSLQRQPTTFRGDVLRLVSGTGIAQAISVLAAPMVARLYAPEAFGAAALFASLVLIFGVVSCLRYELSIVLPTSDSEAANLLAAGLGVSAIVSAVFAILFFMFGEGVAVRLGMASILPYLWLIPFSVFAHGVFSVLNYWNTRTRHFARLSAARVGSQVTYTTATLAAGFSGNASSGAMIGASVAGQLVATSFLGGRIWIEDRKFFISSIRWRNMLQGLWRYRRFPIFSSWSGVLNAISWQLPVLMLGVFFSPAVVGYYALGMRILQVPMNLIGNAIGQVFIQRASEAREQGTLTPLVEGLFGNLVMVGLFPMLVATMAGRDLYIAVFGERWAQAGVYTQILGIWALLWFISSPLSKLLVVLERQEFVLKFDVVLLTTRVVSLALGGMHNSVLLALALYAGTGVVVYGFYGWKILSMAKVPARVFLRVIGAALLRFLPAGLLLAGAIQLGASSMVVAAIAVGSCCVHALSLAPVLRR